jgi:HPr kinase/phosphorylase
MPHESANIIPEISVADFISECSPKLAPEVLAGSESVNDRILVSERIQKLGLALTGFTDYLRRGRVKVVGKSEISYLTHLTEAEQEKVFEKIDPALIPCLLVTKGLSVPASLLKYAQQNGIPLLRTELVSSAAINVVTNYLQERLAPQITIHGVLMGMYGIGVLLLGESGIGKSECALDLVSRGHRLISDDAVLISRIAGRLVGDSPDLTRGHLEIRGLGIISVTELFGVSAVGEKNEIELSIEFKQWDTVENVERLGFDVEKREVFGVQISNFILPVSPARNLSTLVETAVKLFLLKRSGFDAAHELIEKHSAMMSAKR